MNDLCLVHLVRHKNGLQPFQRFIESYRRHSSGISHDFLLVFKGFKREAELRQWLDLTADFAPRTFRISDHGFDLRAYGLAARKFDYRTFCFLNSFSEILADDWLGKMHAAVRGDKVGLVGATGSSESMYSNALLRRAHEPPQNFLRRLWTRFHLELCRRWFEPMPNYHVRTNAFMMSRDTMLKVWPRLFPSKRAAYLFENGKHSLTQRVLQLNLDVCIVGKDGKSYPKEQWHLSNTFRNGQQENLLVADNQTRQYLSADASLRRFLSLAAWGNYANPGAV